MIITRTPYRVSLFGGTTDFASYYSLYGALIIGFTINQYCYISCRYTPQILPYHTKLIYSKTETVDDNTKLEHNGARGVLQYSNIVKGIEIAHMSDLPSQTGMGSSSSFVVGLLKGVCGLNCISVTKHELAKSSIYIERTLLKEQGGIQDQIWASYGGLLSIDITQDGNFFVKPLPISQEFIEEFKKWLVLVYVGHDRQSYKIAKSTAKGDNTHKKVIHETALEAYDSFRYENIVKIGDLLDRSWQFKKKVSNIISNAEIDKYYEIGKDLGALGGKLLGAGGSGFLFFIVPPEKKQDFLEKIGLLSINFGFDTEGSKILNHPLTSSAHGV